LIALDIAIAIDLYSHVAIQYHHALDRTFHALGDPSRRQMLAKLAQDGECSAGELGRAFGHAQPTISKHIKVLEKAGLIEREIAGRTHRFRLNQKPLDEAGDWISCHKRFWEGTLERLEGFVAGTHETEHPK
jgi:DNA-binding transcriptional ArsR family regulator